MGRGGPGGFRAMIDQFLFLYECADALQMADFFGRMKKNAVWMDFKLLETALAQFGSKLFLVRAVGRLHMQDKLIQLQRVIVHLSELDLPCADVVGVIEDML